MNRLLLIILIIATNRLVSGDDPTRVPRNGLGLFALSPETYFLQLTSNFFNLLADFGNAKDNDTFLPLSTELQKWLNDDATMCISHYNVPLGCINGSTNLFSAFQYERQTRCFRKFVVTPVEFLEAPSLFSMYARLNFVEEYIPCNFNVIAPGTPITVYYFTSHFAYSRTGVSGGWKLDFINLFLDGGMSLNNTKTPPSR